MPISWTNDLDTGIEVIDRQHRKIVDYINQLERASQQHDRAIVGRVLAELVDYTLSHFAFEESLQNQARFKFAKIHKSLHDMFARDVADYQARHQAGEDVAAQISDMLGHWLLSHIKREDQKFVADVETQAAFRHAVADETAGSWLDRTLKTFFK